MNLLKRVENGLVRPALRKIRPSKRVQLAGINIVYRNELDGGGAEFGQEFVPFLKSRGMPKRKRIFEWCSGPAFIGFSLLGSELGESLCLADINPAAVAACRKTVEENDLSDRVSCYVSNNLQDIPSSERWDLVVSNPPHFIDQYVGDIRAHDPDWKIHREFFRTISPFLTEDGIIVLQENNRGSTVNTFRDMIYQAGLEIIFTHGDQPHLTPESSFYFIGLMPRGSTKPIWC
jgi:predicted RNA methylase